MLRVVDLSKCSLRISSLTRMILHTVCRGSHASLHPVASFLSCCSDIPLRRRCNAAIILPYRTARKIPVTGPEQGSQQGDGGDTQRIRWSRSVHRVMQARAIHGVAFVILPLPVSRRVVRKRRGKQGNQNFGPRKESQPDQRCSELQGNKRVRVRIRDEERG